MRDLLRQWNNVERAVDLKTNAATSEQLKLMANALSSLSEIVIEHRQSFERYRLRHRSLSEE